MNNFFKQEPGTNATFEIKFNFNELSDGNWTKAVDKLHLNPLFYTETTPFSRTENVQLIKVISEICTKGKFWQKYDQTCQPCAVGTRTTVDMALSCEECYQNAVCLGKDNIYPIPGYVRMHDKSDLILRCFNKEACSGGEIDEEGNSDRCEWDKQCDLNFKNCAEGYQGDYCGSCAPGYWKNPNMFTCYECTNSGMLVKGGFIVFFIMIVMIIFKIFWRSKEQ